VNDYWTGDVASLHFLSVNGASLKLIPEEFAAADANPIAKLPVPGKPYHGYYFLALDRDESVQPVEQYRQDTDGKAGKVHHRTKFAVCAYPVEPGVTGNYIYISGDSYNLLSTPALGQPIPKAWPPDTDALRWNRCPGGG
jgi:hypothetical protein